MPTWIWDHAKWNRLAKAARHSAGRAWNQLAWSRLARRAALVLALTASGAAPFLTAVAGSVDADRARQNQAAESAAALRALLTQPDAEGRRDAVLEIGALGALGAKAGNLLVERLYDRDAQVRACTALVLLNLGQHQDAAVGVLCKMLESAEAEDRCLAAFILGDARTTDAVAAERLAACLAHDSAEVRLHAAEALIQIAPGHAGAVAELSKALASQEVTDRAFAVNALGGLSESAHPTLSFRIAAALADSDHDVAAGSALTLIRWNATAEESQTTTSVPDDRVHQIVKLLEGGSLAARRAAAVRLGVGVEPDSKLAEAARPHLKDDDAVVRSSAALALMNSPRDSVAVETSLLELLESEQDSQAIVGLGVVGRMPTVSRVLMDGAERHLDSGNGTIRILAAAVVSRVTPEHPGAIAKLSEGIVEGSPETRTLATRTLRLVRWQNDPKVKQNLTTAVRDQNLRVRAAANHVLAGTGTPAAVRPASFTDDAQGESGDSDDDGANPAPTAESAVSSRADVAPREPGREPVPVAAVSAFAAAAREESVRTPPPPAAARSADTVSLPPLPPEARDAVASETGPFSLQDRTRTGEREFKGIEQVSTTIVPSAGDLPDNPGRDQARQTPGRLHQLGVTRGFPESAALWTPPAVKHNPLYFQEINLERYGYHYGCLQSVISGATFAKNVALLPAHMIGAPPCSIEYAMGYERPGSCAEVNCYRHKLFPTHDCDDDDSEETVIPAWKISR